MWFGRRNRLVGFLPRFQQLTPFIHEFEVGNPQILQFCFDFAPVADNDPGSQARAQNPPGGSPDRIQTDTLVLLLEIRNIIVGPAKPLVGLQRGQY